MVTLFSGCSSTNTTLVTPANHNPVNNLNDNNHWNWGIWEFRFNANHTKVELIPKRHADYHFCVTKFMEVWPCNDCLTIGKPVVQADKTVKLNVTMKHPFPNTPRYTGFDVRGMVYFPPTTTQVTQDLSYASRIYDDFGGPNWLFPPPYGHSMPLRFSRADQGGGELLNADGYSCYLIPGLTYSLEWPIFSYSDPEYNTDPTPELTTINPYKLFALDTERRMFLVSDEITREYHFALPPGPFCFGYAVDASWWPPNKTPVTDPATDFPRAANAEDPWLIEFEQLLPIKEENVNKNIFKVTVHHRGLNDVWGSNIWAWGLADNCQSISPQFGKTLSEIVDDFTTVGYIPLTFNWWYFHGEQVNPGHHLGVLVVGASSHVPPYLSELEHIYGVRFVDIYIEG
jgi:hypothetical protein